MSQQELKIELNRAVNRLLLIIHKVSCKTEMDKNRRYCASVPYYNNKEKVN